MDMMTAVRTVFSKYATFSGRAGRPEFWWWALFSAIVTLVAALIDSAIGHGGIAEPGTGPLEGLWALGTVLPSLAVTVRRLHDIGRSGWWWFIGLIPVIGWLILLYWTTRPTEPGTNHFN